MCYGSCGGRICLRGGGFRDLESVSGSSWLVRRRDVQACNLARNVILN